METVRVIYRCEADGWWAESPDIEGWSVAGDTYVELVKLVEEGVSFASSNRPKEPPPPEVPLDQTTALIDYEGQPTS